MLYWIEQLIFSIFFRYLFCGAWAGKLFCLVMTVGYLLWKLLELWQVGSGLGCMQHFLYDYVSDFRNCITCIFPLLACRWYWRGAGFHSCTQLRWRNLGKYTMILMVYFGVPRSSLLLINLKWRRILMVFLVAAFHLSSQILLKLIITRSWCPIPMCLNWRMESGCTCHVENHGRLC